jgi:PPOX class probable FMN-dependent enzyme
MADQWRVDSLDQIAEILGQPIPGVVSKVADRLDAVSIDFIRHSPLILVSTVDAAGRLDVSPKGDAPGFCHVADGQTLLLPDRKGNKLAFGFKNILQTRRIGLLFLLPRVRETLRVNGSAEITREPALLERLSAQGKPALLCTRIHVEESFMHCGKALIRSKMWQPEHWQDPPDVSFGRQMRDRAVESGTSVSEAEQGRNLVDELAEQAYRDELY